MTYNGVAEHGSVGNATDIQFGGARTLGGTATISCPISQPTGWWQPRRR
jgi:hypothetical protein